MKRIIKLILTSLTIVFLLSLMLALTLYWLITYRTQGEYFNSGGISIHYTVEGKSDPVILIHGFAVNSDINWRRTGVINTLKNNFKVVSLDLRGHGLSGKPHVPNEYGLKMVSDIINLMDHLKISKAHIAGYSLGGFVALKLATLYPERVKSLSVLGAGWEEPKENSFFKRALKNSVEKLESNSGIDPISTFIEHDRKTGLLHKMWVKTLTKNFNDHKALSALLRNLLELQVDKEDLEKINFPICIIVGERDPLRKSAEKLHNALLNSKLTVIPSKNHLTTLFSSEFHSTLRNFLLTYSN